MVLVNSGFYTRKNVSVNYPVFGQTQSEAFASRVLGP